MCGGYSITSNAKILEARYNANIDESIKLPNYNARPGQQLPVILDQSPNTISSVYWGYQPHWLTGHTNKNVINTRSESVFEKPFFKDSIRKRRCLIIADGFYEWKKEGPHNKQPYRIIKKNNQIFTFAGIWDTHHNTNQPGFSIITRNATQGIMEIHSRMPVILEEEDELRWLNQDIAVDEIERIINKDTPLNLLAYPVSDKINIPSNNSPDLTEDISGGRGGT